MEQMIDLVAQRVGIPKETARKAVEVVLEVLKERLPAPLAGQVEAILAGSGEGGNASDLPGSLGGLFGNR
ncbi:MAG: DUF2267 domain-containing protein [Chloroflexi bacterium]|nr:DUF2267 domain-containing protein [Chloroflexota bacterium]